jgi:hypothetical protein
MCNAYNILHGPTMGWPVWQARLSPRLARLTWTKSLNGLCTQRVKSFTLHTEARRIHSLHISMCFFSRSPYHSFTSHIFTPHTLTISPRAGHEASLSIIVVITSDSLSMPLVFVSFLSPLVYATALYVFKPACTFLVGCQNPPILTRTTRSERYRLQSRVILEHLPLTSRDHHFSPLNS